MDFLLSVDIMITHFRNHTNSNSLKKYSVLSKEIPTKKVIKVNESINIIVSSQLCCSRSRSVKIKTNKNMKSMCD